MKFLKLFAALLVVSLAGTTAAQGMLADRHVERGMQCDACHTSTAGTLKENGDYGICASCHGDYQAMVAKTEEKLKASGQPNPHAQHDGALPCTECHKGHQPGTNYCGQCHDFTYKVP